MSKLRNESNERNAVKLTTQEKLQRINAAKDLIKPLAEEYPDTAEGCLEELSELRNEVVRLRPVVPKFAESAGACGDPRCPFCV